MGKKKNRKHKYSLLTVLFRYTFASIIMGSFCNSVVPINAKSADTLIVLFIALLSYIILAYIGLRETKSTTERLSSMSQAMLLCLSAIMLVIPVGILSMTLKPCPQLSLIQTGLDACMMPQYFAAIVCGYFFGIAVYLAGYVLRNR